MRGTDERTGALFSYVDLEARVRADLPLRSIRAIVNEGLAALEREFAALYSPIGRPSIPPEKLLRAMLLQAFYSIRSERQLIGGKALLATPAGLWVGSDSVFFGGEPHPGASHLCRFPPGLYPVLAAAGDLVTCPASGDEATAALATTLMMSGSGTSSFSTRWCERVGGCGRSHPCWRG